MSSGFITYEEEMAITAIAKKIAGELSSWTPVEDQELSNELNCWSKQFIKDQTEGKRFSGKKHYNLAEIFGKALEADSQELVDALEKARFEGRAPCFVLYEDFERVLRELVL